jgi:hypothetical protein
MARMTGLSAVARDADDGFVAGGRTAEAHPVIQDIEACPMDWNPTDGAAHPPIPNIADCHAGGT